MKAAKVAAALMIVILLVIAGYVIGFNQGLNQHTKATVQQGCQSAIVSILNPLVTNSPVSQQELMIPESLSDTQEEADAQFFKQQLESHMRIEQEISRIKHVAFMDRCLGVKNLGDGVYYFPRADAKNYLLDLHTFCEVHPDLEFVCSEPEVRQNDDPRQKSGGHAVLFREKH